MNQNIKILVHCFFVILISISIFDCGAKQNAAPRLIKDSLVFIYPSEAREKQIEGTVVLKVFVNEEGEVTESDIDRSSGYDILDETAMKVAETAKFKPARINGEVKAAWITWPLVFEISTMEFYPDEWIVVFIY